MVSTAIPFFRVSLASRRGRPFLAAAALLVIASLQWVSPAFGQSVAEVRGTVRATSGTPIGGTRLSLVGLDTVATITDSTGSFSFRGVRAGPAVLTLRHIGFQPVERAIVAPASGVLTVDITLAVIPLDTVQVQQTPAIPSFEEHRRMGLGRFITRAELAKQENRKMSDILAQVPGIKVRYGRGGSVAWLYSSRRPIRSMSGGPILDDADVRAGAVPSLCFSQVYLDRVPIYRAADRQPLVNINEYLPHQVEAIEYYPGPSVTPAMYARLNSQCGVLVIHTRRY